MFIATSPVSLTRQSPTSSRKPHPNGRKMHLIDGFKNQALPWSVILPASAGLWLTITRSTSSKQQQNWLDNSANKRGSWRTGDDGLERAPKGITPGPSKKPFRGLLGVPWSASGYARGLRTWIGENVTAIHAIEFSVHDPRGWAGTADALLDVGGTSLHR